MKNKWGHEETRPSSSRQSSSRPSPSRPSSPMLGLIKLRVLRGVKLAIRDVLRRSSDPYIIVRMGPYKLKTHVIKKNVNPEWNEELTLSVHNNEEKIRVQVFDKDTFSQDDPMGDADLSIDQFMEVVRLNMQAAPNHTVIRKLVPNRSNCLADESTIYWMDGKIVQDVILRLRNVECGEVELQLQWVSIPNGH